MTPARRKTPRPVVGWREWVELPHLGDVRLKAKIDTGARTSALHAFGLIVTDRNGVTTAEFELHPIQRSAARAVRVTSEVIEFRKVRSSNGKVEMRPVIRTVVGLGEITWPVEVTLTARDEMGFRMLLGRTALRRRFLVDPGRSYLQSAKSATTDHQNNQQINQQKGTQ